MSLVNSHGRAKNHSFKPRACSVHSQVVIVLLTTMLEQQRGYQSISS
uniref:Uncharacterized protein n=1 Tax=Anguilla anguilla TaxID=7936 RepID=A0A0E9SRT5_ANGAN